MLIKGRYSDILWFLLTFPKEWLSFKWLKSRRYEWVDLIDFDSGITRIDNDITWGDFDDLLESLVFLVIRVDRSKIRDKGELAASLRICCLSKEMTQWCLELLAEFLSSFHPQTNFIAFWGQYADICHLVLHLDRIPVLFWYYFPIADDIQPKVVNDECLTVNDHFIFPGIGLVVCLAQFLSINNEFSFEA